MITRAYQNAEGFRQEVTLSAEDWEALTEGQLEAILGFEEVPAPVAVPEPIAAPAKGGKRRKK